MKGLKISPPQSVARIDHTSFLCAERASSAVSFHPPIHHPFSVLPSHPLSSSSIYPFERLGPIRTTCHSSSNPSRHRTVYVRASSLVCGPPWKRGIYEILVKTLLSGLSGVFSGRARTCKRFRPVLEGWGPPYTRGFAWKLKNRSSDRTHAYTP